MPNPSDHSMHDVPRAMEHAAIAATVEARIATLLQQRQRDRHSQYAAQWSPRRIARETELRALVRLVRQGRRLARETEERADAVTAARAARESQMDYHTWQAAGPISEPEPFHAHSGMGIHGHPR